MESTQGEESSLTTVYHASCWVDSVKTLLYDALRTNASTQVVVVGAGIAGLSTAYCLSKAGYDVIVLEDKNVGSGETGRTTAHLTNALDDRYFEIENLFGEETARLVADSHTTAIKFIEDTVTEENIACDFKRVNGYLFLHPTDKIKTLEDELAATRRAGIDTSLTRDTPCFPKYGGPCLRFTGQAQFHPLKYIEGLAKAITRFGGKIFTSTHVTRIVKEGVEANGFFVKADHVVVATNTPINDMVTMHTKQFAYRTYVIAARIPKDVLPHSLWWDTGDQQSPWQTKPYHYIRTQPFDNDYDLLICGGEDHKTGQAAKENIPEEDRYTILEYWARERFPFIHSIAYRWSGQVMEPLDFLGFIGKNPNDENIYIVTGDSGNGMTHGTIAGMLISDLIKGKHNRWQKIYDPARVNLRKTGDYLKEVGSMAAQYLDYLLPGDITSIQDLRPNDGAIVRSGVKKLAVYKDVQGRIHAFSATCPHLGCNVRWNKDEQSFDCPCHGSRFSAMGKVINGPALEDLKPVEVPLAELLK
ncbi:FAD-dependent oxidoreductase [Pseudochryseolinea flava]|uniref:(2Fe-2S)-binding protein n=1 Tax=Pseudochryseolinea flava TaxID=2059302 RepID=A0A364Y6N2_9BACT|nr:FAD-dependent oxidoreductase [Pseudochryseolinea flava]RAW01758.1 (2Fe-2S)-binding protein [Pseudochryseolinea flava]